MAKKEDQAKYRAAKTEERRGWRFGNDGSNLMPEPDVCPICKEGVSQMFGCLCESRPPAIVSYGGGTNSTAMLIEMVKRGMPVDLILFSDTGGEKPHTYAYIKMFSKWLQDQGYPKVIIVKYRTKDGSFESLEDRCLSKSMLPSIAYGVKACSQKYKISPQDIYVNHWPKAWRSWRRDGVRRVIKYIGYDADESHRAAKRWKFDADKKFEYKYPLLDWDMGRDECTEVIKSAGLSLPGKSACFFCPASKRHEILDMAKQYPDLAARALAMESKAQAGLQTVKGLGRSYAWADLLKLRSFEAADKLGKGSGKIPDQEIPCGCYD